MSSDGITQVIRLTESRESKANAYLDWKLLGGLGGQPGLIFGIWHCQLAAQQGVHVAEPLSDLELLALPYPHLLNEKRTSCVRLIFDAHNTSCAANLGYRDECQTAINEVSAQLYTL